MTLDQDAARRSGVAGRWLRRCRARWRPILLTLLLVGTLTVSGGYAYLVYRPDLRTNQAAARLAVKAASDGAVALLSYSPETLDHDFANAKARISDHYLSYYQGFAERIVAPSAQRGRVTTAATVVRAAASELQPDSAVVLVFLRQKTSSKDKPQPTVTSNSLRVELTNVNGSWLIDNFEAL